MKTSNRSLLTVFAFILLFLTFGCGASQARQTVNELSDADYAQQRQKLKTLLQENLNYLEEMPQYEVIYSHGSLKDVRIFFFTDVHSSVDDDLLFGHYVSKNAQLSDIVLLESWPSMQQILNDRSYKTLLLPDKITVMGWDDMEKQKIAKNGFKKLFALIEESKQTTNQEEKDRITKICNKLHNHAMTVAVIERNNVMFETIQKVVEKYPLSKIFVSLGRDHLLDRQLIENIENRYNFAVLETWASNNMVMSPEEYSRKVLED